MINFPLIVYFLFLIFFFCAFLAIVYHLKVNRLNEKISTITTLIFVVGCLLVITFNVSNAIQINWDSLSFNFTAISANLDFEDSSYE